METLFNLFGNNADAFHSVMIPAGTAAIFASVVLPSCSKEIKNYFSKLVKN